MKRRILALLLAAALCLGCFGCGKKQTPDAGEEKTPGENNALPGDKVQMPEAEKEPEEPETPPTHQNQLPGKEALLSDHPELSQLDTKQVTWGPGKNLDENGRPVSCVNLQEQYGEYSADFVRLGEEYDHKVYLTFDEGYENGYTGAILDTLKEKGVTAVFFVTLPYAKQEPELIQRMIDEGHVVGNHTARHPNMTGCSPEKAYDEVGDLHTYLQENFGYDMYLFRFPQGAFSQQNLALLQAMGYRSVFWSFAYADWDPNKQPAPETAKTKLMATLHSGEIFLLHAVSKTNTEILGDFIDQVRAAGYSFEAYDF